MSNLLKSKFLLGVMTVAIMFVGVVAVNAKTASADTCSTGTVTLRVGSKGEAVKCLQAAVGVSADGSFGPKTKAAVVAFQSINGLVADGLFGNKSRAVLVANGGVSGSFPAGCASASGYSSTTGQACYAIPSSTTLPAGCTSSAGYSPTTGASCATGVVVNATGPVSVALASDNPASGSFIVPASGVQFAKFTFSGTGTVTSVKLQRTGISASTTLSNVYLYDGATRLTDGSSIGSDNTVTFNTLGGIFSVAGSKTITVVADTLVADYSLAFKLVGYTANGTASVVSVAGNEMFGAAATLATVALAAATGSGATDAGPDINVWQSTATVNTRDVLLNRLALRQIGSITSADINNFKLYVDGVLSQTVASLDSNGYVTFSTPVVLKTGARILKVTADILGGSSRTVFMSLRGSYDISAADTQYNANGTATGTFPNTVTAFTVNAGTMTVVKATDSPSSNVTIGASDQNLATYKFTAYGEPIKVETLRVGMITTGGTVTEHQLRNVRILVNGAQVGSNTSVPAAAVGSFTSGTGTQFTTNFVVYPGTPAIVEVHSDIYDNEDTDNIAATTVTAIQVALIGGNTSNAVPQVSLGTIHTPSTTSAGGVLGNVISIGSGSISVAKTSSYTSPQTTAVPSSGAYKIASFQLSGNATEAVNLNTIYVGWTTGSTVGEDVDLSDLYVVYGGTMTPVKGTVATAAGDSDVSENSNSWSINRVLAKNETIQVDVYATLASTVGTDSIIATLAVAGTTANSGIATYADASDPASLSAGLAGQTITGAAGTFAIAKDTANTAPAQIVDDSGTIKSLTTKFVSTTDSYTVTDVTATISGTGGISALSTVTLKNHDTGEIIGSAKPAATSITWSGLNILVNAGTTLRVDAELALSPVGAGAGTTGGAIATTITTVTARNSSGTSCVTGASQTGTCTSATSVGNAIYVYKAIPTISQVTMTTGVGTLSSGTMTLSKFKIDTNGTGTIAWNRILFTLTKTTPVGLADFKLYNLDTGVEVAGTDTIVDSADAATCAAASAVNCNVSFVPTAEEQISGARNYALKATVSGSLVSTDYVTTQITTSSPALGFVASDDYTAVATTGSFAVDDYSDWAGSAQFIWSDVSASGHDATSETITDWSNDYLVKNLALDSQTLHY